MCEQIFIYNHRNKVNKSTALTAGLKNQCEQERNGKNSPVSRVERFANSALKFYYVEDYFYYF